MASKLINISQSLSYLPWQSCMTVEPIEQLLYSPGETQDDLTRAWKEAKLAELTFVGLAGAIVSEVFASAFSWNNALLQPRIIRGLWYGGLLLALVSIAIATQQSIALHRLGSNRDSLSRLRLLLSYRSRGASKPRYLQVYLWQTPVMLLNISISLFLLGLVILVCHEVVKKSDAVMAVLFTIATVFGFSTWLISAISLYWGIHNQHPCDEDMVMTTTSPVLASSPPRLHVTANLPPVISFSSVDEPQLEVRMTLEYSQPVIVVLKNSRLWPLHHRSALTLHNASSGNQEYLPRVDAPFHNTPIPLLDAEHKEAFVGLKPGQTSVVSVSFRPYKEPYDYENMKDRGVERYQMLFPIGMQFLTVGGCYEIGIQGGCTEAYMLGDMDNILGEAKSLEWAPASDLVEVVPGEKCQFRVTA